MSVAGSVAMRASTARPTRPSSTLSEKATVQADLPATARVTVDEGERRTILAAVARAWRRDDLETMVREGPLIAVTIDAPAP